MSISLNDPSPLAGEGGPRSGSDEGSRRHRSAKSDNRDPHRDPSSVGFADTFFRKGRRDA